MTERPVRYVVIARIPAAGVDTYDAYERAVLPLLADHAGTIERRLRTPDRAVEVHVLRFGTPDGLDRFRGDPRRTEAQATFERSGASVEVLPVVEVD